MISASFVNTAVAEDFDFDQRFPKNRTFESEIRSADKACLPEPFPLIEHNYGYRLADGLVEECVSENMSTGQAAKYTILALAATATGPVGIAAAGYASSEMSSDGIKCVLKALVSASSGMTPQEKAAAKSAIDIGAAVNDWYGFAENVGTVASKIPELAKPEHVLNLKSAVEAGAAVYERTGEAKAFVEVVSDTAYSVIEMAGELQERAAGAIADFVYGETNNRIAEAEQAMRDCRFDEISTLLQDAREAAVEECRGYGVNYRLAEVEFRSHIYRNRRSLRINNALFNLHEKNTHQNDYVTLHNDLTRRRQQLADFSKNFAVIESMKTEMFDHVGDLYVARSAYESAYESAVFVADTGCEPTESSAEECAGENVCPLVLSSVRELESMLGILTPGCRDKLISGSQGQIGRPDDLPTRYNNSGHVRSQGWWREVDRIRESFAACDTDVAEARVAALHADIVGKPIFLIENGQCREVEQDVILEELAGLKAPESCPSEDASRLLPGGLYVTRDEAGLGRVSKAAAGQELFVHADFGVTGLLRSDVVYVQLEATLPDGRRVTFASPTTSVRPDQETGYRATASFLIPEDVPPGTCRVTGRLRQGGLGADAGEVSFAIEEMHAELGDLVVSPTPAGPSAQKYAIGDPINAAIDVGVGSYGSEIQVSGSWVLTFPDGRTFPLQPSEGDFSAGIMSTVIRTIEANPLGVYQLEVTVGVDERILGSRTTSFELVPLFENPEIFITESQESTWSLEAFRPNDPLFVIAKMIYNSVDPSRQVHIVIDLDGPDSGIRPLGIEAEQGFSKGEQGVGVGRTVPAVIQEGLYTATITLDGGAGQRVTLTDTFRIVYPVQFEGIWTRDGSQPPQIKTRFAGGDPFEWFLQYRFVDTRPNDLYSSAIWTHAGEITLGFLSSDRMGPDTPNPGRGTSSYTDLIPQDMPSGSYDVAGVVWYNDVAYYSQETTFKVGQEPTITITSPQPGFDVDKKVMIVTGTCADLNLEQAQMVTNGEAVPIKLTNGEFSAKTVLRPGPNDIHVMAANEVGVSEAGVWGNANIRAAALKVVLSWEAQGPDIDLWVEDPQGKVTNYHHKGPSDGRTLDVDDTSGPGMETYTIEVPVKGRYDIVVHYFADKGWRGQVDFRLQFTTWEATSDERRWSDSGTVYTAARDSEEPPGAVAYFTIVLQ